MSQCDRFRDFLSPFMDGEAGAEAPEVVRHVAVCRACAAEVEDYRRLEGGLRRALDRPAPAWKARAPRRWVPLAAAAALAIAAAGVALRAAARPEDPRAWIERYAAAPDPAQRERIGAKVLRLGERGLDALIEAMQDPRGAVQGSAAELACRFPAERVRERLLASPLAAAAVGGQVLAGGWPEEDRETVVRILSEWAHQEARREFAVGELAQVDFAELLRVEDPAAFERARQIVRRIDEEWDVRVRLDVDEVIELVDSPQVGESVLAALRRYSGRDYGRDKDDWRRWWRSR